MAKNRRGRAPRRDAPAAAVAPRRRAPLTPDWPVLVLALLGVLLTGYLTMSALGRTTPAFCTVGSGCDLVQQSRWSTLLGAPIALWGFGLYLLLALAALFASPKVKSWRRMFTLALVGVLVSVYLTVSTAIALETFCTWCLVSFALLVAILAWVAWRRPSTPPGEPWPRWLRNQALLGALLLGAMHVVQAGWLMPPEDARIQALAEHLESSGAKFYGASWCPKCREQKELFGRSAERLPYVECSPQGRRGPIAFACVSADVQGFPTWIIRNKHYTDVMPPEQLAARSGFNWKGFQAPDD
jgi:uncharacterized membrane protein/thiol-disulfide isomerase/thioredoxin